jgi:hypothetical protein
MRLLAGAADAAAASTREIAVEIAAMWLVVFMVFALFVGLRWCRTSRGFSRSGSDVRLQELLHQ